MHGMILTLALIVSLNGICLYCLSVSINRLNMRIRQLERRHDRTEYKELYSPETRYD